MTTNHAERKQAAEANLGKLPKWAQDHISSLQMERDQAVAELRRFEAAQAPSRIWTEGHVCIGEQLGPTSTKRYIDPDIYWVHFKVGEKHYQEVEVGFNYRDERFQIRSTGSQMELVLDCANTVEVRVP